MTLNRQFCLLPERGDELRSALPRLEPVACEGAYFANSVQAKIGQLALLHVAPDVLDRVEFRLVGGQSFQHEVPVERFKVVLDDPAAVRWQAVPDDQQFAANLLGQRLQEFDEMRAADRAGMQPEIEVPVADASYDGKLLPVKAVLQNRSLAFGRPSLDPSGSLAQSAFVDEDDGAPFAAGLFLAPASAWCATA